MRELLFFPEHISHSLQWGTFSQDGELTLLDPVKPLEFDSIKSFGNKGVTLVLPGQQVASYRFAMPKVSGPAKQQAIAFALEGVCSQSLDDIYVIPGEYIEGKQSAVVVDKRYLNDVLGFAKQHNIKVSAIRVDYMLLAKPELHSWVAAHVGQDVLWRTDYGTGGRVEQSLWPFILKQYEEEAGELPNEIVWEVQDQHDQPLPLPDNLTSSCEQTQRLEKSWIDGQSLNASSMHQFNVGDNKFRSLFNKQKKSVFFALKLVVSSLVVAMILQGAFTGFVAFKLNKEQAILEKWLTPAGFGGLSLGDIKSRLNRAIAASEKIENMNGYLRTLSAVTQVLSSTQMHAIQNIAYQAKTGLVIEVTQDQAQAINRILTAGLTQYHVLMVKPKAKHPANTLASIAIQRAGL